MLSAARGENIQSKIITLNHSGFAPSLLIFFGALGQSLYLLDSQVLKDNIDTHFT
jgi:hypothetical protein